MSENKEINLLPFAYMINFKISSLISSVGGIGVVDFQRSFLIVVVIK